MRRNNKQMTTYFILFSLLLIGVVYAILQANLQINGTAKIQANTWDIHFDNIQVNENSVSIGTADSAATIDPENNCKVDFEVTLSVPGDFYEFTIDVVNAGTIDGMIGELNKTLKVNNEVVSEVPDYLDYSVTYSDGVEIEDNHKIEAGTTETYLVRLEFKTDIEELPQATTITTSLEPQYIQADSSSLNRARLIYDVFKTELQNNSGLVREYSKAHIDSFLTPKNEKIYYWYAANRDSDSVDAIVEKYNVLFAGFCWNMFRTTDSGGVKLIYSGIPNNGRCISTGDGQQIGKTKFNNYDNSMAYFGYMYNPDTMIISQQQAFASDSIFGNGVTYENGVYTLVNTSNSIDTYHHYTCNNSTGTCETVRYYNNSSNKSYLELSNGVDIEQALINMLSADNVNKSNSLIKSLIDTWYQNNMTAYTSKLEDVVFCNKRKIEKLANFNPNGGTLSTSEVEILDVNNGVATNLYCENITDQFSLYNPKAQLTYPVGLMTSEEARFVNNISIIKTGSAYWLMSPYCYVSTEGEMSIIGSSGYFAGSWIISTYGIRPVISLKPGTLYVSGDGSKNNPYIVE